MNPYINQAFNGAPKSGQALAIGQPVNTTAGTGRIVNISRGSTSGNANPAFSSFEDPMLITVQLDATGEPITISANTVFFQTNNGGRTL